MAVNKGKEGKKFEEDIKNSFEEDFLYYLRLKDSSSSYAHNNKSRFTVTNPCDFISYNFFNKKMLYIECKSTSQKSLPLTNFREHQLVDAVEADKRFKHVDAYCFVKFLQSEKVYCIRTEKIHNYYYSKCGENSEGKKSIPEKWFLENGVEIKSRKKRTRFYYYINELYYELAQQEQV